MNTSLILEQINAIQNKIDTNQADQEKIQDQIETLQRLLARRKVEMKLLNASILAPVILNADHLLSTYQFITEPLEIPEMEIQLFPMWLPLECTYPRWAKDYASLNIIKYTSFQDGKGYEILIHGLSELFEDYQINLLLQYNIWNIPKTLLSSRIPFSTFKIDFSKGAPISLEEHSEQTYHQINSEDSDMVINTVKIKYVLVMPLDYMERLESIHFRLNFDPEFL